MKALGIFAAAAGLSCALAGSIQAAACMDPQLFQPSTSILLNARPNRVELADLNHDGILDAILPLRDNIGSSSGNLIAVLLGNGTGGAGDGTFGPAVSHAVGTGPQGIAVADLDLDGNADVAVTNGVSNSITILRGHGDGTFATRLDFPCAGNPYGIAVGDFDEDGTADLAVADNSVAAVSMLKGLGGAEFSAAVTSPLPDLSLSIVVADVDADGHQDLVATAYHQGMAVLLGNGDGTFQSAHQYSTGGQPYAAAVADVDADGVLDLIAGNQAYGGLAVLKGAGNGTFGVPAQYGVNSWSVGGIAVLDLDADGIRDILLTNPTGNSVVILKGQGQNGIGNGAFVTHSTYPVPSYPVGLAVGPLNADLFPDLVVASYVAGNAGLLLGRCVPPEPPAEPPVLVSVRDVPYDHGGFVFLRWKKSSLDTPGAANFAGYRVWRRLPLEAAASHAVLLSTGAQAAVRAIPRPGRSGVQTEYWEALATLPAEGLAGYGYTAPTSQDSTPESNPYTAFFITALTSDPAVFYESNVDSGYSVDNLAPVAPEAFTGRYLAGVTHLHWLPNAEADLGGYRLYRGAVAGFVPGPANLLASIPDTGYVDATSGTYCYKLAAANRSGIESNYALVTPSGTTGVEGAGLPQAVFLAVPSPNPAWSATSFRFGLPRATTATLGIYDVSGRLVRALAAARFPAGEHSMSWDLRDETGATVSGGLFFIRLSAEGVTRLGRLVILR